jgi:hypothetical protein
MATFHTQTGTYAGYTRLEMIERILWNLGQISDSSVSYSRYPKAFVIDLLNEVLRDVAVKYPSILKVCIVNTVADKGWYLCPTGMIPHGIKAAYYYTDTSNYDVLEIMDRKRLDREYPGWRTASSGTPICIVPGPLYGNRFTFEVYPATSTAGGWTTQPVGVYLGGAPSGMTTSVTGIATGGSASGLADTGTNFSTSGLADGMAVWNVTDNNYGWITEIGTNRISLTASLVAGRDGTTASGTFAAGDAFEIVTDFAGVVSDWDDDDEQYIFTAELGTVSDFQPQANNILLEYWSYPINLAQDADYPQCPKTVQDAVIDMTTARLARTGHEKTRQMDLADRYEQKAALILEPLGTDRSIPFRDMGYKLKVKIPR